MNAEQFAESKLNRPPITAISEICVYNNPIIIGDVNRFLRPNKSSTDLDLAVQLLVATAFENPVLYLNATQLTRRTKALLDETMNTVDLSRTAIVLPGMGAQSVVGENNLDVRLMSVPVFEIPTQRTVENGKVTGVTITLPERVTKWLQTGLIDDLIVIEDVIATGTTLRVLRNEMQKASSNPLQFQAVSWFCRRPTDVSGYKSVRVIYEYWSAVSWPALNSISTWLKDDEKAKVILSRYKERYAKKYPPGFDKQLATIRGLITLEGAS